MNWEQFDNEEDARTRLEVLETDLKTYRSHIFCPLTKDRCRVDCAALLEPRLHKNMQDLWTVYPSRCESPLVTGVLSVENL